MKTKFIMSIVFVVSIFASLMLINTLIPHKKDDDEVVLVPPIVDIDHVLPKRGILNVMVEAI